MLAETRPQVRLAGLTCCLVVGRTLADLMRIPLSMGPGLLPQRALIRHRCHLTVED